jgi:hypothetical protein
MSDLKKTQKIKLDMLASSLGACLMEVENDLNDKNLIFQMLQDRLIQKRKKWILAKQHPLNDAFEFYYLSDQN